MAHYSGLTAGSGWRATSLSRIRLTGSLDSERRRTLVQKKSPDGVTVAVLRTEKDHGFTYSRLGRLSKGLRSETKLSFSQSASSFGMLESVSIDATDV